MTVYVLLHLKQPEGEPLMGAFSTLEKAQRGVNEAIAETDGAEPLWQGFAQPKENRRWRPVCDGNMDYYPHEITEVEVGMPLYEQGKMPA